MDRSVRIKYIKYIDKVIEDDGIPVDDYDNIKDWDDEEIETVYWRCKDFKSKESSLEEMKKDFDNEQ